MSDYEKPEKAMWDYEKPEYYLNMTTAELLQRARDADKAIRRFERETPDWRDDEAVNRSYELTMRQYRVRSAIQTEIDRQKEEAEAAKSANKGKLDAALETWFRMQHLQPPTALILNWSVQDRQYSGRFDSNSGKLHVSIVVEAGTPGAKKRGARYVLPCNSIEEEQAAIIAESRRPK